MGSTTLVVVGVLVFVATLLAGQFVYWTVEGRRQARQRDLARRLGTAGMESLRDAPSLLRESRVPQANDRLDALLRAAGGTTDRQGFLAQVAVSAMLGVFVLAAVLRSPLALAGLVAGVIPWLLLLRRAEARARRIMEQLPDALELLARSLQAGHGFSEALRGAAEELPLPLAEEFGRAHEAQNLGRDLRDVLGDLCRRNPTSFELQLFTSAVLLQRDTGGNLVELLNNLARTLRDRFTFEGKVRALTAEARFTAWVLGGLPFVVGGLLLVVQPGYLRPLVEDTTGQALLVGCGASFLVGVVLMQRAARVEV